MLSQGSIRPEVSTNMVQQQNEDTMWILFNGFMLEASGDAPEHDGEISHYRYLVLTW